MRAPLWRKGQAITTEKRRRERQKEVGRRKGRQVTPLEFTKHLKRFHEQGWYEPIKLHKFTVRWDMVRRMEEAVRKGRPNKAV